MKQFPERLPLPPEPKSQRLAVTGRRRSMERFVKDSYTIAFDNYEFIKGSLNKPSNIRPKRLFTLEKSIITKKIGTVKHDYAN